MKPRAYSYLRMSTDIQLRGDSRRRQLEASRAYAEAEGLELAQGGELEDIGVSAFKGANVKEGALGRFVAAAEAGAIQKGSYLLVENLDRLSRQKVKHSLALFLRIVGAGITIVTLYDKRVFREDELDLDDLFMSILSMARAHDESVMKSERVGSAWKNKRGKAAAGRPMTKRAPAWLNLSEDRERYEIISERAAVVCSMFEEAASGIGMYTIVARLNASKTKTFQRSQGWRQSYVAKILSNRAVIGEFQPHRLVEGKRIPDGPVIEGYYPPIVEADLFFRAQHGKAQRRVSGKGRKGRAYANLFSRLAHCAYCNQTLQFENKGVGAKGGTYLICDGAQRRLGCPATRWRYADFEASLLAFVEELDLDTIINANDDATLRKAIQDERSALQGELAEKTLAAEQAFASLAAGGPVEFLSGKLALIDVRKKELAKLLQENAERQKTIDEMRSRLGTSREEIRELVQRLQSEPNDEIYRIRAQIASRLRSIVTGISVAPLGSRPITLRSAEKLGALTQGEAADVIDFMQEVATDPEASHPYFAVGFEGGEVRVVFPKDDALDVHYQYEASRTYGIARV